MRPGTASAPALTLKLGVVDFVRMAGGDLDPGKALLTGRMDMAGDLAIAARLGEMFGQPGPSSAWSSRATTAAASRRCRRRWRGCWARGRAAWRSTACPSARSASSSSCSTPSAGASSRATATIRCCQRFDAVVPLTTQFPSTTTAHVTTLHSGAAVGEHGLYEWNVYEPSLDALITPLLFCYAGDAARDTLLRAGVDPGLLRPPAPTLYERLAHAGVASHVFGPASFTPSTYDGVLTRGAVAPSGGRPAGRAWPSLAATLRRRARARLRVPVLGRVDSIGHQHGPSSPQFAAEAQRCLDALDAGLRALPEGTVVLLAADHGQVDVDPATTVYVNEAWPGIVDLLARDRRGRPLAPAGSARDLFLHCRPGRSTRSSTASSACSASARRSTASPTSSPPAGWGTSASACARGWPTSACCPPSGRRCGGASATASTCASAATTAGWPEDEARTQVAALVV